MNKELKKQSSNKHLTNPLNTKCINPKARVMIGTLDGWQYMPVWGIVGPRLAIIYANQTRKVASTKHKNMHHASHVSNLSQPSWWLNHPLFFLHIILYLKTDCNKNKCLGIGILALDVDFGLENANMGREIRGSCSDQACDGQTKIKPPNWPSRR